MTNQHPLPKPGDEFVGRRCIYEGFTATVRYVDEDGLYYSYRSPDWTDVYVGGCSHETFHRRYEPKPVITEPHTYPKSMAWRNGTYVNLPAITIHPEGNWTVAS